MRVLDSATVRGVFDDLAALMDVFQGVIESQFWSLPANCATLEWSDIEAISREVACEREFPCKVPNSLTTTDSEPICW